MRYSSERDQLTATPSIVTTVLCTELGTTLLIGLENTTARTAYFRCPSLSISVCAIVGAKFLFSFGPAHPGAPLLRNSRGKQREKFQQWATPLTEISTKRERSKANAGLRSAGHTA